jgi:hypothetical protein
MNKLFDTSDTHRHEIINKCIEYCYKFCIKNEDSPLKMPNYEERRSDSANLNHPRTYEEINITMIIDGTEQPLKKSGKYEDALDTWSAKKHTYLSPKGRIIFIGRSKGGNRNDLELWEDAKLDKKLTNKEWICGDSIFRGLNKITSEIRSYLNVVTPINKPKDEVQKKYSQRISCLRLGIENVF